MLATVDLMPHERDRDDPAGADRDPPGAIVHPLMVQRWTDVVFLHWAYSPQVVQRLLPAGVAVDTIEGSAWVGLVSFRMDGLGFPGLAPLPLVGSFPEVNVRTYVRASGRHGVWFFSLDIDRLLPVLVARCAYHLNYCAGGVTHERSGDIVTSRVRRRWPRPDGRATTSVAVERSPLVVPGEPLVEFLTSRWGLVSATRRGGLRHAAVEHPPWALHHAEVLHLDDHLIAASGLPAPTSPPHVLWSPGVDVRIGRPHCLPTLPQRHR